jgi:hypothetical protein
MGPFIFVPMLAAPNPLFKIAELDILDQWILLLAVPKDIRPSKKTTGMGD